MLIPTADDLAKARDNYFDRAKLANLFAKLPRVAEVFDSIEAQKGSRVAMLHMNAALTLANLNSYTAKSGAALGIECVSEHIALETAKLIFLALDLDMGHFHALYLAVRNDSQDIAKEMGLR